MTRDDLEDAAALSGELGYPTDTAHVRARFDALDGRAEHGLLVAEDGGGGGGWIHVHDDWTLESGRMAELLGLVVREARRGAGIGRALVAEAERWAAARGCTRLRVRSNVVRERTHRFYDGLGFRRVKSQQVFDKELG